MSGWQAFFLDDGRRIVVPVADMREHEFGGKCWCSPTDDEGIEVHNSMDRREEYERGRLPS